MILLLALGLGFGMIFSPAINTATSGVARQDSGVASALVNTKHETVSLRQLLVCGQKVTCLPTAVAAGRLLLWQWLMAGDGQSCCAAGLCCWA